MFWCLGHMTGHQDRHCWRGGNRWRSALVRLCCTSALFCLVTIRALKRGWAFPMGPNVGWPRATLFVLPLLCTGSSSTLFSTNRRCTRRAGGIAVRGVDQHGLRCWHAGGGGGGVCGIGPAVCLTHMPFPVPASPSSWSAQRIMSYRISGVCEAAAGRRPWRTWLCIVSLRRRSCCRCASTPQTWPCCRLTS